MLMSRYLLMSRYTVHCPHTAHSAHIAGQDPACSCTGQRPCKNPVCISTARHWGPSILHFQHTVPDLQTQKRDFDALFTLRVKYLSHR